MPNTDAPVERLCRCNCGETVQGKKSSFRPGHDARVVGLMARGIVQGDLTYTNHLLLPALDHALHLGEDTQSNIDDATQAVARLFTLALATKFENACHKAWEKAISKTENGTTRLNRKAKEAGFERPQQQAVASLDRIDEGEVREVKGSVKVGRWEYPARKVGGQVWRNEARDGSGEWIPVADASKFQTV